MQEIRCVNLE